MNNKKFIVSVLIAASVLATVANVDARSSSSSSRSSSSRSSYSSTVRSTSPTYASPTRSVTSTRSTPTVKPTTSNTTVVSSSRTYYGGTTNNGGGGGFGSALMGSVVGTIGANMLYDSLKPDQTLGAMVNDGTQQLQEIKSVSGEVVGYQKVATPTEAPKATEESSGSWLPWILVGIMSVVTMGMFISLKQ